MRTMFVSLTRSMKFRCCSRWATALFARYLLGCFWYSKRRYDEAVSCWRETLEKSPDYAPAHRLLGVYSWNKQQDATQALAYLQRAVALEPENARFLFELDFCKNYWPSRYMSD